MSRYVKPLTELGLQDIPEAGGKACRLAELARHGLPVPGGLVVTAAAFRDFVGDSVQAGGPAALAARPFPAELARELTGALAAAGLEDRPLAVRSSAPGEDGAYRSRAGVYESRLNVRAAAEVLEAVKACWLSLWTQRSLAYAAGYPAAGYAAAGADAGADTGADAGACASALAGFEAEGMAVLIQEMVPCETSGILFTLNPLTGDENEMLVEATWGLAAELASGEVSPDRFVIDFWDGGCRRSELGRKTRALGPSPAGGLESRDLDPTEAGKPCLDQAQLAELARLGRWAQEVFGCPQDIEFGLADGRVFIFQTRPITAYSFPPDVGQWTTANFREVMPGFASVLGQSQSFWHDFSRAQQELFRRLRLWRPRVDEGTVWARTIFGHGYWNVGATKRVAARIPGYNERSMDRTVGIEPAYEGDGQVTPWNLRTITQAVPVLIALGRQYREIPREARAFIERFEAEEPAWDEIDPAVLADDALAERVRWGLELHWQANRWALLTSLLSTQAQEDFHRMLSTLERKLGPAACPSEARLMTGLTGMATAEPLLDLWELSAELARDPDVVQTLRRAAPEELVRLAGADAGGRPGDGRWRKVADWLRRYRHMSNIDEDLSVPRWWEDPTVPLAMLRGYVLAAAGDGAVSGSNSPAVGGAAGALGASAPLDAAARSGNAARADVDPTAQLERQKRVREEEEARVKAIGRRWLRYGLDPFWSRRFAGQYRLVKDLCWWREKTRVYLSRARYHTRRFLVEQGRRWAKSGRLSQPDDIFWLTRDEVIELTGSRPPATEERFAFLREMVRRRRAVAVLYRDFRVPPNIAPGSYGADGLPRQTRAAATAAAAASAGPATAAQGDREIYVGVGCSAGSATAPCRVVTRIEEAAGLQAGEILVAPYANPAWTPLFHLAAGLVLEEGGLLSHSAVVAREYGVPAVLQVKGATDTFRTGDILALDGAAGTVSRIRKRP